MCVVRVRFFLFCATARHSESTRIWLRADFRHARTSMNGIWRAMPPTVVTHCMCELSRTAQRWHAEPLLLSFIVRTFPRIYCVHTEKIVAPKTSHLFSSILSYFRIFVRINSVTLVSHTAITQPVVHNEWRWIYDYRCTACDERTTAHHMLSKFFAIYSDRGVAGILPMEICFRSWSIKVTCVQLNRGIGRFGWCGTAKASELYIEYQPEQDKWYIFFFTVDCNASLFQRMFRKCRLSQWGNWLDQTNAGWHSPTYFISINQKSGSSLHSTQFWVFIFLSSIWNSEHFSITEQTRFLRSIF